MNEDAIRQALAMPGDLFRRRFETGQTGPREHGVAVAGLLAISNYCRNNCDYCGLRVENDRVPRYRLSLNEIKAALDGVARHGIRRLFMISGEDPANDLTVVLKAVEHATAQGLAVMLGLGIYPASTYAAFRDAGAELYALKFETSNPKIFSSLRDDITLAERMAAITDVRSSGLKLGSGNIVGLPGETLDDIARDIALMRELDISWAPIVPYMPAPNTPLGARQSMGSVDLLLREITLVRHLLPDALITAGQPTQGSSRGFADPQGTRDALRAGANLLFVDLTPKPRKDAFAITQNRYLPRLAEIEQVLADCGLHRA